jgi:5'-3' exonuclease
MPKQEQKVTLLVDCKAICYKALNTQFKLTHDEVVTGVHYGFLQTLIAMAKKLSPSNILLFWDGPREKLYRTKLYPNYKIKRTFSATKNENLILQLKAIKEEAESIRYHMEQLGFASYYKENLEADDLFGFYRDWFVEKYNNTNNIRSKVIMASPDEDLFQLLWREHIVQYLKKNQKYIQYTEKEFVTKYKFYPEQWAMYKALIGCKSDNVPGIKGVGPVAASTLLRDKNKPTFKNMLLDNNAEEIQKWLQLVQLPFQHPKKTLFNPFKRSIKQTEINEDKLIKYCQKRGFRVFLNELKTILKLFNQG